MSFATIVALIGAAAPWIEQNWSTIQTVMKLAESLMAALGITPSAALQAASEIHLGLRLPTPEEESVMMARASDVGQSGGA